MTGDPYMLAQRHAEVAASAAGEGGKGDRGKGSGLVGTAQSLKDLCARAREPGAVCSGPPIAGFEGGWAKMPFAGEVPHYWRRNRYFQDFYVPNAKHWDSLCGTLSTATVPQAPAFGIGTYRICRHCERIANLKRIDLPTAADRLTWADHLERENTHTP